MPLRKLSPILFRIPAMAVCLLLTACFDAREELWVKPDGSARAELRYHVPDRTLYFVGGEDGLNRKIRDLVATQPELRLDRLAFTPLDGQTEIAADLSTDSLLWLRNLKKNHALADVSPTATDFAGAFKVSIKNLRVDFSRTLNIGRALGFASLAIGDQERQKRRLYCAIHLPLPAIHSNAQRIEDGGRTLIWDNSLGDAIQGPLVTEFHAPIPLPRWLLPATGGGAVLLCLIAWRIVRRWKHTHSG